MPSQAVDLESVRAIGAALPDVKVGSGNRGAALRLGRQILACVAIHKSVEPNSLMVRIGPKRREALLAKDAKTYYLPKHYAPYPVILVRLSRVSRASLKRLLTEAWEFVQSETK